ncbi:hypothetical protein HK100_002083 [Physocladia obscura]|uniref:N-acetyltransferase domain-containing protein n=1 Tax=Physocladia obscura TaxID=109957 RepID=A0AAD5SVW2_9FUNG|nr:hypothetical protein HK100_002083 [Physocladia obscura]
MQNVTLVPATEFASFNKQYDYPKDILSTPATFISTLSQKVQTWLQSIKSLQQIEIALHKAQTHVDSNTAFIFFNNDNVPIGSVFLEPLPETIRTDWNLDNDLDTNSAVYMSRFMLDSKYIGNRIGDVMMRRIQELCLQKRSAIVLDTWEGNAKLRRFYERHGFVLCGVFPETGDDGNDVYFVSCYVWNNRK